jgi:hypothetical protein
LFLQKYTQSLEGFSRPRRKDLLKSNSFWSSIEEKALEDKKRRRKSKKVQNLNNDSIDYGNLSSSTSSVNNFDNYDNYKESSFLF